MGAISKVFHMVQSNESNVADDRIAVESATIKVKADEAKIYAWEGKLREQAGAFGISKDRVDTFLRDFDKTKDATSAKLEAARDSVTSAADALKALGSETKGKLDAGDREVFESLLDIDPNNVPDSMKEQVETLKKSSPAIYNAWMDYKTKSMDLHVRVLEANNRAKALKLDLSNLTTDRAHAEAMRATIEKINDLTKQQNEDVDVATEAIGTLNADLKALARELGESSSENAATAAADRRKAAELEAKAKQADEAKAAAEAKKKAAEDAAAHLPEAPTKVQ